MNSGMDRLGERHGGRGVATLASTILALTAAFAAPGLARGATVSSAVEAGLATKSSEASVLITLTQQVNDDLYAGRPTALIRALRRTAAATQAEVTDAVDGPVRRFWLINAFSAQINRDELAELAADPAVATIELNPTIRVTGTAEDAQGGWGIDAISARSARTRFGVTGAGVRVGSIDTGVDATNPELAGSIAAWRDFVGGQPNPYDDNGHGTHTIGTMVARNVTGQPIGIAPGAQAVVAKAIRADGTASGADLLAAAEWMTDPDGDPVTADYPTVINNSWAAVGASNEWFRPMVQRWVAMGITPVFGSGNAPGQLGNPASYPEVIAVGASEPNGQVWANTSRGSVTWNLGGALTTLAKPDLTAPGVGITSTVGNGYGVYSGTSMAAPHVAGTIALLKQVRRRPLTRTPSRDRFAPAQLTAEPPAPTPTTARTRQHRRRPGRHRRSAVAATPPATAQPANATPAPHSACCGSPVAATPWS